MVSELFSKSDFEWYKKKLDVEGRYEHDHIGSPDFYPCKVESVFVDYDNRPYTYEHEFFYKKDIVCECCGNVTKTY